MSGGPRHRGRELAVLVLFQLEVQPGDWREPLAYHGQELNSGAAALNFAEGLVTATVEHLAEIDQTLSASSSHWRLEQMGALERSVLRVATAELSWIEKEPTAVIISEAVGLARQMAGDDSGKFVNGVLGEIGRTAPGGVSSASPAGR